MNSKLDIIYLDSTLFQILMSVQTLTTAVVMQSAIIPRDPITAAAIQVTAGMDATAQVNLYLSVLLLLSCERLQ